MSEDTMAEARTVLWSAGFSEADVDKAMESIRAAAHVGYPPAIARALVNARNAYWNPPDDAA